MKAKGIWATAAKMDALRCYNSVGADGSPANGFVATDSLGRNEVLRLAGFNVPRIENLVERWKAGERLADESLAALFELIVERGDCVPPIMRDFAILRIRGERLGKAKKSPWELAERDEAICRRIEDLLRASPDMPLHPTRHRRGDGTSAADVVAKEFGMMPGTVAKIWQRRAAPGYLRR